MVNQENNLKFKINRIIEETKQKKIFETVFYLEKDSKILIGKSGEVIVEK